LPLVWIHPTSRWTTDEQPEARTTPSTAVHRPTHRRPRFANTPNPRPDLR